MNFPEGKSFAFTVFDDTDRATVQNVRPVYELLHTLGFRTTKSVWPFKAVENAEIGGESLQDQEYLQFILWLQQEGFEIGFHNARSGDSLRALTSESIAEFKALIGDKPRTYCQHVSNRENLYWGVERLRNPVLRSIYTLATRGKRRGQYEGSVESSPYFWADVCRQEIDYVRNLVFDEINLLNVNPSMPYHDPAKPFVKYWFSGSEGANVESFTRMIGDQNQERLEREGGVCIMYTHFAYDFYHNGRIDPTFKTQMEKLSRRNGWFVPVSTLLDFLKTQRTDETIPGKELLTMEARWVTNKLRRGTS